MRMYYLFFMENGNLMMLNLSIESTSFRELLEIASAEVGHRVSELIFLDENGLSPDLTRFLYEFETIGTKNSPVFLYLKSGSGHGLENSSDVTYIFQMLEDAQEQAQHILKNRDPEKVYLELPEKAKVCRKVTTDSLQVCATLVEQHQFLYKGWLALINNLDSSMAKTNKRGKRFRMNNDKMVDVIARAGSILENYSDVIDKLRSIVVPSEIFVKPAPMMASTTAPIGSDEKYTLYDFISRADPEASLEDLPDIVNEKLEQLKEQDVAGIYEKLEIASEQSKNPEFREFKGINKRFSQLEFSLKACEERKNIVHKLVGKIVETPKGINQDELALIVDTYRRYMLTIFDNFAEFRNMLKVFEQSKQEILKNLRTRMVGFVVQTYDRLRIVNNDIIQYEYKGEAVRIHMDLIGQIRDAPVLYSQSVSEVVRRRLLKTELFDWHTDLANKCSQFSADEEKIREQLGRKLKKHFLHALFPGLFDKLPVFYVKSPLDQFDADLPCIEKDYIKELREAVPDLEPYLKVTVPNVTGKLATKGVKPHPPFGQSRVESFLTEEPMRMARSHFNYSPAAWLSEDGGDSSPIPHALMCRSPDNMLRESQCRSIPYVPSLQQLEGLDGPLPSSSAPQSAPISIPNSMSSRVNFKQSNRRLSSQDLHQIGSGVSSDTSLLGPETPVTTEVTLAKNAPGEGNVSSSSESVDYLFDTCDNMAAADVLVGVSEEFVGLEDAVKRLGKVQDITASSEKKNDVVFKYLHQTAPRDFKLLVDNTNELKIANKELEKKVENLEIELDSKRMLEAEYTTQIAHLKEEHKKEIENTQAECIKQMSVEFELMTDSMTKQNNEVLEAKNREIEELRSKLEKQTAAYEKALQNDPYTEEYKKTLTAEIRGQLEKEFRGRIEVITKAVECKKDEAYARQIKTLEIENRVLSTENEAKSKKLEVLSGGIQEREALIRQLPDGESILDEYKALKETNTTSKVEEQVAAIRARIQKVPKWLDNEKLTCIDSNLKVYKVKQLARMLAEHRNIAETKKGGIEAIKLLDEHLKTDSFSYMNDLDKNGGDQVRKIVELVFELVWINSLTRALPNSVSTPSRLVLELSDEDAGTVAYISTLDEFVGDDKPEFKKVAKTLQSSLNVYAQSLCDYASSVIPQVSVVKDIVSQVTRQTQPLPKVLEDSFYHQAMTTSTFHSATSPLPTSLEVDRTTLNTICTQTRLCMQNMDMLVSLQDIKIGSIVLVVWRESCKAYSIFCATTNKYFVKESTIRRLGIHTEDPATRRDWILARIIDSETCSIKKPNNRYNLPVDTIVRRVDIELVPLNSTGPVA